MIVQTLLMKYMGKKDWATSLKYAVYVVVAAIIANAIISYILAAVIPTLNSIISVGVSAAVTIILSVYIGKKYFNMPQDMMIKIAVITEVISVAIILILTAIGVSILAMILATMTQTTPTYSFIHP